MTSRPDPATDFWCDGYKIHARNMTEARHICLQLYRHSTEVVRRWTDDDERGPKTMNLTPFDTGERAEPKPWITDSNIVRDRATGVGEPDEYGKVDFDDDESRTVATVHVSKDPVTGSYVVHVMPHDDDVRVARHGYDEEVVI